MKHNLSILERNYMGSFFTAEAQTWFLKALEKTDARTAAIFADEIDGIVALMKPWVSGHWQRCQDLQPEIFGQYSFEQDKQDSLLTFQIERWWYHWFPNNDNRGYRPAQVTAREMLDEIAGSIAMHWALPTP